MVVLDDPAVPPGLKLGRSETLGPLDLGQAPGKAGLPCCPLGVRQAKVVRHAKAETFQLAEAAVPRALFTAILGRIGRLRAAPRPG